MSFRRNPAFPDFRSYGDAYTAPRRQQPGPKLGLARAVLLLLPTLFLLARSACTVAGTSVCARLDTTPSTLASGIHALSQRLHNLPALLHSAHTALLTLADNARSLSGTPACPSADCARIAARSAALIAAFHRTTEAAALTAAVVSVLVAAHYVNAYSAMLLRALTTTYRGKREPGARSAPASSPVRRAPPATAQRPSPLLPAGRRLQRLAEEASVLLEVFSRTVAVADGEGALRGDQKTMLVRALGNVLDIKRELRIVAPEADEGGDNRCVICYDSVADMVVLPCRHLAMCMTCCDGMGIMEGGSSVPYRAAKCPICRTLVTNRMKVFRS